MSQSTATFDQSAHGQFIQSPHLMRVCGMAYGVEYRKATFTKVLGGFFPLFPSEGDTVTGQDFQLAKRRRFTTRSVSAYRERTVGGVTESASLSIAESQDSSTLEVTTTGGADFDPFTFSSTTNDDLFNSGYTVRTVNLDDGWGFYVTKVSGTFSAENCTTGTVSDSYSIGDDTYYSSATETRGGEVDFETAVSGMRTILDAESLSTLWSAAAGTGSNRLNRTISFNQFDCTTPGAYYFYEWVFNGTSPATRMTIDPATAETGFTGAQSSTDAMLGTGPSAYPSLAFDWGNRTNNDYGYITGCKAQWRSVTVPMDYCVVEEVDGAEAGYGRAIIVHTELDHATVGQIVDVPLGQITGWGLLSYGGSGGRTLGLASTVRVVFGMTATEYIRRQAEGVGGIAWHRITMP